VEARRARALQLRITTAHQQLREAFPHPQPNGDEDRYDTIGLATFTKALPHNRLGEVDPAAYRALLRALQSSRTEDFRRIPLGGSVKLANPEHPTQSGVVTFGAPDILDQVARSANAAMKAAWYHKWLVHRRLRPEEAGGRVHHHLTAPPATRCIPS
jgi:hypothetical protein